MTFMRDGAKLTGVQSQWDITADNGKVKTRGFCPTCGAPISITYKAMPNVITIHAASLDDPARFKPQAVTYGIRAYDWDPLDPKLTVFETMPPPG
jgi:hypothetical protein